MLGGDLPHYQLGVHALSGLFCTENKEKGSVMKHEIHPKRIPTHLQF